MSKHPSEKITRKVDTNDDYEVKAPAELEAEPETVLDDTLSDVHLDAIANATAGAKRKLPINDDAGGDEEVRVTSSSGGQKGQKLSRFDLIPALPLDMLARVYGMGAKKYADNNWRKGYDWSLNFAACMRHLWAFWRGEETDPESGLPHLAHAAWHCFAMMEFSETGDYEEFDDRYKG